MKNLPEKVTFSAVLALIVGIIGVHALADAPTIFGPSDTSHNIQPNLQLDRHLILKNPNIGSFTGVPMEMESEAETPWTAKFPINAGSTGQVLTTDGTGVLSWGAGISSIALGQQAWIAPNGSNVTGVIGNPALPFATPQGAEAVITDAAAAKPYLLHIGPGSYDVTTMAEKKSYVMWEGGGQLTTVIDNDHSGPINLTNSGFSVASSAHNFQFTELTFGYIVSMDTVTAGLVSSADVRYSNSNVGYLSPITITGLGADTVNYQCSSCLIQSGYSIENAGSTVTGSGVFGTVNVTGSGGFGVQALNLSTSVLAAVNVMETGSSFTLFGLVGGIIGGPLSIDGATSQALVDIGTLASDPTLTNGGTINYQKAHSSDLAVVNSAGAKQAIIQTDGKTGIGMTSLTSKLSVRGSGAPVSHFQAYTAGTDYGFPGYAEFEEENDATNQITGSITGTANSLAINGTTDLTLQTGGTEKVRVTNAGDVGINNPTPYGKFDVEVAGSNVADHNLWVDNATGNVIIGDTTPVGQGFQVAGDARFEGAAFRVFTGIDHLVAASDIFQGGGSTRFLANSYDIINAAGFTTTSFQEDMTVFSKPINAAQAMTPGSAAEIFTVTTVGDTLGSLNNTYFTFFSANDTFEYYAWFDDGAGVDPAVPGATGIQVTYTIGDSDATIAANLQAAASIAVSGDFTVSVSTNVVTFNGGTNYGPATDVADGSAPTGFTFNVTQQGNNPSPTTTCAVAGELRYDDNFFYVCTAVDTWKRTGIGTW